MSDFGGFSIFPEGKEFSDEDLNRLPEKKPFVNTDLANNNVLIPFEYYANLQAECNPATFPYIDDERLELLFQDLTLASFFRSRQIKAEESLGKKEKLRDYSDKQIECGLFLNALQQEQRRRSLDNADDLTIQTASLYPREPLDGRLVKYLGIPIAKELTELMHTVVDGKTKSAKALIGAINERRLYWVWGGGLLDTVLTTLVPDDFYNTQQARIDQNAPNEFRGYLSWILYYTRFFIELSLLVKHTVKFKPVFDSEKMTEEEYDAIVKALSEKTWTDRFKTQWDQRKYILLNDSIWGTINLLSSFKILSVETGNPLTIGLLLMDALLACWRFWEAQTAYQQKLASLNAELEEFEKIKLSSEEKGHNGLSPQEISPIDLEIAKIKQAISRCEADWKYQKINCIVDLSYAVGLLLAFAVYATPYLSALTSSALILALPVIACYALTLIYSLSSFVIEQHKTKAERQDARQQIKDLKQHIRALDDDEASEKKKRLLYLQIQDLEATTVHQQKMIRYQTFSLIRSAMTDVMIPAIVFSSLVFFTTPVGLAVGMIALAMAVALLSKILMEKLLKPKDDELEKCSFDEGEYGAFRARLGSPSQNRSALGIFSTSDAGDEATENQPLIP